MLTPDESTMNEEPLLGDAPTLSSEAWDGMLDDTFIAPPGIVDHLVDSYDPISPTTDVAEDGNLIDEAGEGYDESEFLIDTSAFGGAAQSADGELADDSDSDGETDELDGQDGQDGAASHTESDYLLDEAESFEGNSGAFDEFTTFAFGNDGELDATDALSHDHALDADDPFTAPDHDVLDGTDAMDGTDVIDGTGGDLDGGVFDDLFN
ncbi:hypothetical protein EG850_08485 [Gulosibacter macacae]|uniref:Uncharacterized protein n=1 Tax=Gulosibacter macacae TaxID=2488791 RepID=A0A3P3VVK8_9MICO|nr:hypothetical protein [Gulosibacter macacae]RRJ86377.1 hypothetical protein EG850_08485 [Gulosibacter macacae]